jgi:hypothetical protein
MVVVEVRNCKRASLGVIKTRTTICAEKARACRNIDGILRETCKPREYSQIQIEGSNPS